MPLSALFRRILLAAALAGLVAGLFVTALQAAGVIPLILEAETYEAAAATGHGTGEAVPHDHADEGWSPAEGGERLFYTAVANVLTAVGFGLLLAAGFALKGGVDWRHGLLWGAAGFAAFSLAPALGLPPELPGAEAAPLGERQIWWLMTAVATGAGLAAIAFLRRPLWALAGVALIALPHLIGAPQPEGGHGGTAPADLARAFVLAALLTSLAFWLVLGAAAGFFYKRLSAA